MALHIHILGVPNCANYEASASLIRVPKDGGKIEYVAIAEERLSRKKHSYTFPLHSVDYCLKAFGLSKLEEVDYLYTDYARIQRWLNSGPGYRKLETDYVKLKLDFPTDRIRVIDHHDAHAATAFYPSGFPEAAVIVVDGLGSELTTQSLYHAEGTVLEVVERGADWGIGRLYGLITSAVLPYGPEKGYGKTMGLAPYGAQHPGPVLEFKARDHGMTSDYSEFFTRFPTSRMVAPDVKRCTDRENILEPYFARAAYDVQQECERQLVRMAKYAHEKTGSKRLCLSGGVALNGGTNSRILRETPIEEIWIQPACSDMGVPFGAALLGYFRDLAPSVAPAKRATVSMTTAYTGVSYPKDEITKYLKSLDLSFRDTTPEAVAKLIAEQKIVAWFEGGSEFGPRALGHRSILADPRGTDMKNRLNATVKFREGYRPYGSSILAEEAHEWFHMRSKEAPFMLQVVDVKEQYRAWIPAVTHVDNTTRPQTVTATQNPHFHRVLKAFHELTGVPVLLNTSFNINREPIVETPRDALICSMGTAIDYLYIEGLLVDCRKVPTSTFVTGLEKQREAELVEQLSRIQRHLLVDYDPAERDRYLEHENRLADWHREYRAKYELEKLVQTWSQAGSKIAIVGTRQHTACLYLYIPGFAELNIATFVPMDDLPGERYAFGGVYPECRLEALNWSEVDAVLVSTHEYQRVALERLTKAGCRASIETIYDLAGDSLIYVLPGTWPVANHVAGKRHGLSMTKQHAVRVSNIDFDYEPSVTSIGERYAFCVNHHYCRPDGHGGIKDLHPVPPERFDRHINTLRQNFTLTTPARLFDPSADLPETTCLVTFDDGFRDVVEHALPILKRWKTPATVFCSSQPLVEGRVLDVHKIQLLQGKLGKDDFRRKFHGVLDALGLPKDKEDVSRLGLGQLYRYDDEDTRRFKMLLNYELPYPSLSQTLARLFADEFGDERQVVKALYMSVDDLKRCLDDGIEIGLHTHSHRVLSRLSMAEQRVEIEKNLSFFKQHLGLSSFVLAYPYGVPGTWNTDTKRVLKELGIAGAFTLGRKIVKPADINQRWEIPRFDVNDVFAKDATLKTETLQPLSSPD